MIVPFEPNEAHDVGALVGRARTTDVVDAHVAITAHRLRSGIVTSDETDLQPIARLLRPAPPLFKI